MPRPPKPPATFDAWLGNTVDNAARGRGGRDMLASLLGWSKKTVERKARGETGFLVSELTVIASALSSWTVEKLVTTALADYGDGDVDLGVRRTIAERNPGDEGEGDGSNQEPTGTGPVSDGAATVDPADNVTYLGHVTPPLSAAADEKDRTPSRD